MSDRTWNDTDMENMAARIAVRSRESLEAHDQVWVYLPCFQETVQREALAVLKTVLQHERLNPAGPEQP